MFDTAELTSFTTFEIWLVALAIWLAAFAAAALAAFNELAIALLAFAAALFVAASPQAIPKAPITRTAESAIIFFITNLILLSSSKIRSNFILPKTMQGTVLVPCLSYFRNIGQYREGWRLSQPQKRFSRTQSVCKSKSTSS